MAETLAGAGAASTLARAQALVGGQGPAEVVAGGRRFAALSAGPASRPAVNSTPPASIVTETLSEGVPAGAVAALLAARRPAVDAGSTPHPMSATLLGSPALSRAVLEGRSAATEPDRPAMGRPAAEQPGNAAPTSDTAPKRASLTASDTVESLPPADLTDQAMPSLRPASSNVSETTEPRLPAAAPDTANMAVTDSPAGPSRAGDDAITMKRPRRVRPFVSDIASVIVDSEFDREAQAVRAELSKPLVHPADPADDVSAPQTASAEDDSASLTPAADQPVADQPAADQPVANQSDQSTGTAPGAESGSGGFGETAWFLDALDADTLSRAENGDIRDRQAQNKAGIDRANQLDESTRRQYSLRSSDSLPVLDRSTENLSDDAPEMVSRQSPLVGLLIFLVLAVGVAGWFLFGR